MKKTKEPKTEIPPYEPDVIEKTLKPLCFLPNRLAGTSSKRNWTHKTREESNSSRNVLGSCQ